LARIDAQPRWRNRRNGRHGRPYAQPPHWIPRPTTYNKNGTECDVSRFFSDEKDITPLKATTVDMLRFAAWLARAGIIAANNLQPYFLAISNSFAATSRSH
jgi:hypothetical protein